MKARILVVNDNSGAQSRGLVAAIQRRGCETVTASLSAIGFDTESSSGLAVPGFEDGSLPDAVLVRSISAGSFEAITRRLGVLHALGRLGVPVWNSAKAIENCVDKSTTTFLLHQAGLPTPATFAVEGLAAAQAVVTREAASGPLVLKPLFGAQGRGIRLVREMADLPAEEEINGVYYLQRYVARAGPPFRDYRVFVCAGRVVAMMARRGEDWITNVNRGATPEHIAEADTELEALALASASAVGTAFAGVDIVADAEGRFFVLEVNSMPAWSGLQSVAQVSIADAIAEALVEAVDGRPALKLVETAPEAEGAAALRG
ncbi:RimK family alpha-L-glutamate ligase [Mesorhizobium sp. KR1-2]|uniref:ATP-grasp domain-containing protein n=1 Tax=Mesorhizobium sp. KR1-2 TaxID=3156609 RepID=UPI0032B3700C